MGLARHCKNAASFFALGLGLAFGCYAAVPSEASGSGDPAAVAASPAAAAEIEAAAAALVKEWSAAWESGSPDRYFAAYDQKFRPAFGWTRTQWREYRRERLRVNKQISVQVERLRVLEHDDRGATVVFVQRYRSHRYGDVCLKTLRLVRRGDEWKIAAETTGPLDERDVAAGAGETAPGATAKSVLSSGLAAAPSSTSTISSIRLSSGGSGGGHVLIELSGPATAVDMVAQPESLRIKLEGSVPGANLSAVQKSPGADELISGVRVEKVPGGSLLTIDIRRPWVYESSSTKQGMLIKVAAKTATTPVKPESAPVATAATTARDKSPVTGTEEECYGGSAWQATLPPEAPNPEAARIRNLKLKEGFRDCEDCPEMVVLPKGSFGIGAINKENPDEAPVRRVDIRSFAAAKYEVTWKEFEKFVLATSRQAGDSCRAWGETSTKWDAWAGIDWALPGYVQTPTHPVVCVTWDDAKAYATWLSEKTGKRYRLFSEAEWEYAARGTSLDAAPWGRDESKACRHSNVADTTKKGEFGWPKRMECADGSWGVSRVGVYLANAYGLHDMVGNVWEWVEDCASKDYKLLATDGRPYTCGHCQRRIMRGGAWSSKPESARFGKRGRSPVDRRSVTIGFRLARDLE